MAHDDLERASNSPAQGSTADPPSRRYGVAQGTSNISRVRLPSLKSKTPSLKSKTPSLKSKTPPSTDKLLETELHANVDRPPAQARVALFQTRTKMLDPFAGLAPPLTRSAPDMNAWPASKLQSSDPGRAALVRKTSMQTSPGMNTRTTLSHTSAEHHIVIPGESEALESESVLLLLDPSSPADDPNRIPDDNSYTEVRRDQVYPSHPATSQMQQLEQHAGLRYGEFRRPKQSIRDHREKQMRRGGTPSRPIPLLKTDVRCTNSCCGCAPEYNWYSVSGKGCCWVMLLIVMYIVFGPVLLIAICLGLCGILLTCQCDKMLH
eukprot:scpid23707/ scgid3338/ 